MAHVERIKHIVFFSLSDDKGSNPASTCFRKESFVNLKRERERELSAFVPVFPPRKFSVGVVHSRISPSISIQGPQLSSLIFQKLQLNPSTFDSWINPVPDHT
jgi:hypothetical protein